MKVKVKSAQYLGKKFKNQFSLDCKCFLWFVCYVKGTHLTERHSCLLINVFKVVPVIRESVPSWQQIN